MHELLDLNMQEEHDPIFKELQLAEEARQKALEEAETLKATATNHGGPTKG